MSEGIIVYNRGEKCLIRMSVMLYSLRRCGYKGNIKLLLEGPLLGFVKPILRDLKVGITPIPNGLAPLVQKTSLWRYSPYERSVYFDTDMLFLKDPSELFADLHTVGYAVTRFTDWKSDGNRIKGRINAWRRVVGDEATDRAIAFGPAVNTGCFGFNKKLAPKLLEAIESSVIKAYSHADHKSGLIMGRVLDEIGSQIMVAQPEYEASKIWDQAWNYSVSYGKGIYYCGHFHGGKAHLPNNPLCDLWHEAYWEVRNKYKLDDQTYGDKRLADWLVRGSKKYGYAPLRHKDLTVVSAGDLSYAPRLTKNFEKWMKVPGLREQNFTIFCINADPSDSAYDGLRAYPNVKLIRWDYEAMTVRESAFSAFVFGVAKHVKTAYFFKIDGDAVPTGEPFVWPEYQKYTICGAGCGYTRNKPAEERASFKTHFLNRLDIWYGGEPIFPANINASERHGHRRLKSFAWIEKTEYTRRLAAKCGGRLPIPSQDSLSWYYAHRLGEPMLEYKFGKFLRA